MSLFQYIKDTRGELRHVAWPTQTQTFVYTAIVIGISLFVAVYLGFFDYIFTTGLSRILPFLPQRTPSAIVEPAATSSGSVQDITVETEPLRMDTADTE